MGTIANAKVTHYYNCYNGDFIGCLLRKAAKALKKLASQKSDETLMTENDFFVRIDEAKKQIKSGKCKKMLQNENLDDFLARNGYV